MFEKVIIIDAKGHLLGRLASRVAKEILQGQKVVVVRTEEINKSGSLYRNKVLYFRFLSKRTNSNPRRGPFHHRSPSMIFWRCVRGMVPHKITKGKLAMARLKIFEGVPAPYDRMKRVVMPKALKYIQMKPHRKFCRLGDLATCVGWKQDDLIKRLEAKRVIRIQSQWKQKDLKKRLTRNAKVYLLHNNSKFRMLNKKLKKFGAGYEYNKPVRKRLNTKNRKHIKKYNLFKKHDVRRCQIWCKQQGIKYTKGKEKEGLHWKSTRVAQGRAPLEKYNPEIHKAAVKPE